MKDKRKDIDPEYIEGKIQLIERGLPIDISEDELAALEETLRGARSFYVDILKSLHDRKHLGEELDEHIAEENGNLAGVELALRKIDEFREAHPDRIKK